MEYYITPCLKRTLDKIRTSIHKQDNDRVFIVDGAEGSGKSVFSFQIARYIDESFNLSRVCMTPEEFKSAIEKADKFQAIVYDEAYGGLSSRASLSAVNKLLVGKMMEMRQKNLFVIIVLPSFFLLDRYVALFRSTALLHVYTNKGRKGYWIGFNRKNKKLLYIYGKKLMSYSKPYINNFKGRFYGIYTIDEAKYREKKRQALENGQLSPEPNKFMLQRNLLIDYIIKNEDISFRKAELKLKKIGFNKDLALTYRQINEIVLQVAKMGDVRRSI